jgi:hypothetical protein
MLTSLRARSALLLVSSLLSLLALGTAGCGGKVVVGSSGAGGTGGTGGWEPCAGKSCGEYCTPCDPADPDCALPGTNMYCNALGACVFEQPTCPGGCTSDAACAYGTQWCVGGACVACDNSGEACDLGCINGWGFYTRNGCTPCACAPPNDCTLDAQCGPGSTCYAGAFCWDYCDDGDPSCCQGNVCSQAGCSSPPPMGCFRRGCPMGQSCENFDCASSSCGCDGGGWSCTDDCGGGVCVTPL